MKGKYVVILNDFGREQIVCFPDGLQHDTFKQLNPISAGFFIYYTKDHTWEAYGKSISLDIPSRPEEDSELLKRAFMG